MATRPVQGGPVIAAASQLVPGLRKGSGYNWLGFCPLHGEVVGKSRPSFSFNEATGLWHCFAGCGGGGLPLLLKKLDKGPTYIDRTMERLRPHLKETAKKKLSTRGTGLFRTSYPLPEKLLGLYEYAPVDLLEAKFSEDVLRDHDIGYDTELERIVYPIRDLYGELAGLSGKPTAPDARGKYLVYEQEIRDLGFRGYTFHNHNYVWRWERVYPAVYRATDRPIVCVCEGFKAALWMVMAGFPNTVALMGTSLSDVQQRFLMRLGTETVLCLDDDHFGRVGTEKACYKLRGLNPRIMRYPYRFYDLQPDDLTFDEIREGVLNPYTPSTWRRSNDT